MTPTNRRVINWFLESLVAFVLIWAGIDVCIAEYQPDGSTISWSLALLGASSPAAVYWIGHISGGVLWGLIGHFWWGLPDPRLIAENRRLRVENERLEHENARLRDALRMIDASSPGLAPAPGPGDPR